jgi:hypothetical protein
MTSFGHDFVSENAMVKHRRTLRRDSAKLCCVLRQRMVRYEQIDADTGFAGRGFARLRNRIGATG